MSKTFCGIADKVPKGKKRGNARECAEIGQVRRFGQFKLDQKQIDIVKAPKKDNVKFTREQLLKQVVSAKGSIRRFGGRVKELEDRQSRKKLTPEEIDKLALNKRELKKAEDLLKKAIVRFKKVELDEEKIKIKEKKANEKKEAKEVMKAMKAKEKREKADKMIKKKKEKVEVFKFTLKNKK